MVEIKSFFGDWKKVETEQAIRFVTHMLDGMNCGEVNARKYINEKHLRGITVEELLKEEEI